VNHFLYFIGILSILTLPIGTGSRLFSQEITDELKAKLPKSEQYKIMKAETFKEKGKTFLDNEGNLPDDFKIDNPTPTKEEQKKLDNFYDNRIKASYCFRTANGLIYEVVEKYIKGFWDKFSGDKRSLEGVLKIQKAAYDTLVFADNLRAKAESSPYVDVTIPLVSKAEKMEQQALFKLEKVLLIYMYWPEKPNMEWLASNSTTVPKNFTEDKTLSKIEPAKKDSLHKASNIYGLMHISENQVDKFNEFLKEKHPDKVQNYLIDFQGLYESVIDSLHKEWHKYLYSGSVSQDTLTLLMKSYLNPNATEQTEAKSSSNTTDTKLVGKNSTGEPVKSLKPATSIGTSNTTSSINQKSVASSSPSADNSQNVTKSSTLPPGKSQSAETIPPAKSSNKSTANSSSTLPPDKSKTLTANNTVPDKSQKPLTVNSSSTEKHKSNEKSSAVNKVEESKKKNVAEGLSNNHDFIFRVQIAACRNKLSDKELKDLYHGNETIVELFENHWYKYTIGNFTSFNEALDLRDKTNIKGVFVAAYFKNKRVKIPSYLKTQANR
jgi:hypothetical protein